MKTEAESDYRILMRQQPPIINGGEPMLALDRRMFEIHHEFAVGAKLVLHRELFGRCYQELLTDYFKRMPQNSGAMVSIFVPMRSLMPLVNFPGDIDLLIIPYEGDHLVVSQAMAVELKVVRAKFTNQGKSPNEFGFSQAEALLKLGFPFAALGHLIVSDKSPPEHHQKVKVAQIIDEIEQTAEMVGETMADLMPSHLIQRCFGRLKANSKSPDLGLFASYIGGRGGWFPLGREAARNPSSNRAFQENLGEYYQNNVQRFINMPRYPRSQSSINLQANSPPDQKSPGNSFHVARSSYGLSLLHEEVSSIFVLKRI